MVEWLAGNRIRGTSTERTSTSGFNPISAVSGGWKELGRTTLGSAGDTISVASLADKRYYMLLCDDRNSGSVNVGHRAGNSSLDSGSNYSKRPSINGATDLTHTSQNNFLEDALNHSDNMFMVNYISNLSNKEKLGIGHCVRQNTAGAGNAPNRTEYVGKWANTSNVIDTLATVNFGTGDLASGSELVVLGWDPDDTHTDNFWEELASVTSSSNGNFSSGTFTAKKYLWVQTYCKSVTGNMNIMYRYNSDSGNNYVYRVSANGGTDYTQSSQSQIDISSGGDNSIFSNSFIINNSSKEKLGIHHTVEQGTAGAGNAPTREEVVSKWSNTSSQITEIDVIELSNGEIGSGSIIKVWGHD